MTHRTAEQKRSQSDRYPQSPPPSYAGYPPNSPQPYQSQPYQQPVNYQQAYEMPAQQHNKYGGGYEQQPTPQVVYVQTPPSQVVVKDKRHTKDDVAIGFCAGCATAVCCCGCTVM